MQDSPMEALFDAFHHPDKVAARLRQQGRHVIRVLGHDAPYEILRAAGLSPVRLVPIPEMPTPLADALIGASTMGKRGRSLLEQVLADEHETPLLMTHADSELPQIFAALRELQRAGDMRARPIHFLDLLHLPRASSERYNRTRVEQFALWLERLSDRSLSSEDWQTSVNSRIVIDQLLQSAQRLRECPAPQLTGREYLAAVGVAQILPPLECMDLLRRCLAYARERPSIPGQRIFVAGAPQYGDSHYRRLSEAGFHVVGELGDLTAFPRGEDEKNTDWQTSLANPNRQRPTMLVPPAQQVAEIAHRVRQTDADYVLYLSSPDDEPSGWDGVKFCQRLHGLGISAGHWRITEPLPEDPRVLWCGRGEEELSRSEHISETGGKSAKIPPRKPRKKGLSSIADFNQYQKAWFQSVRERVAEGAPFGVVNANSPQEILRAMDIPFVVNQWWASIVAAKQQSERYFGLLRKQGYPSDVESYSSQGLAALFDEDTQQAPWGGLPRPDFVHAVVSTDATPRIYQYWAEEADAELFLFERTLDPRIEISANWWEKLPDHWDDELESCRLDLLRDEMRQAIHALENRTGRKFDEEKFRVIMDLVNEQEEYYRLTRDLIAKTHPAPVCVSDTMPATMVPQWHRGTEWGRDAARRFYEEVKGRVDAGEGICGDEQLRLMWVGRGMWSDMGFYSRWRESHGAVFVWSMYLALAADGYIRNFDRGRDPLRALAARFAVMGDELRMPTWAGAWHVREAESHGVHGAIALADADPFVLRALRRAGIPVLALNLDNFDQPDSDRTGYYAEIGRFLDSLRG